MQKWSTSRGSTIQRRIAPEQDVKRCVSTFFFLEYNPKDSYNERSNKKRKAHLKRRFLFSKHVFVEQYRFSLILRTRKKYVRPIRISHRLNQNIQVQAEIVQVLFNFISIQSRNKYHFCLESVCFYATPF